MTKLYQITKNIISPIDRAWHRFEVKGLENIPEYGPLMVAVGGHANNLDPIHFGLQYSRELNYMAKEELFKVPVLGSLAKQYHAFSVSRGNSDMKAIRTVLELLGKDQAVLMFVEGTRTKTGELGRIKRGLSFMSQMAVKKGIPVQISPTLLQGTYELYPAGFVPFLRKLKLSVNETINPSDYDSVDELTEAISDSILELK